MRLLSGPKVLIALLLLVLVPLATQAFAAGDAKAKDGTHATRGDKAKAGAAAHGDDAHHGEKKPFPLAALCFVLLALTILCIPAFHRLNVGGTWIGGISTQEEETSGH